MKIKPTCWKENIGTKTTDSSCCGNKHTYSPYSRKICALPFVCLVGDFLRIRSHGNFANVPHLESRLYPIFKAIVAGFRGFSLPLKKIRTQKAFFGTIY